MPRHATLALLTCAFALGAWWCMGRPGSIAEARFAYRIAHISAPGDRIALAYLMPGDWELACDAHGYGGDFHLDRYHRTYPAVGDMQDGAWGMFFIAPDGSYVKARGTCRSAGVVFALSGCLPRQAAVLRRVDVGQTCPTFSD